MTSQSQKTIYRFIRVPDTLSNANNTNTVLLIKQQQQNHHQELTTVQKVHHNNNNNHQAVSVKVSTDNVSNNNEKKMKTRRDDYRRFQHNQIEKARREKINNWIMELGKIIDDNSDDDNDNINSNNNHSTKNGSGGGGGEALSKGGILEKACEYIAHLKTIIKEQRQSQSTSSSEELMHDEIRRLQDENDKLKVENAMLKRKFELVDDIEDDEILLKRTKTETDVFNSLIEFSDSLPADDIAP